MSRRLRLLPLVQWLLRHRLPEEWAEFVLGDLEEEYHRRRRPWLTVVGVVSDVKEDRFNFRTDRAAWYLPYAQQNSSAPPNLVIESEADFDALTG